MANSVITMQLGLVAEQGFSVLLDQQPNPPYRWTSTVLKRETVSCTGSAFTALSPPSGATGAMLIPAAGAVDLTLKGVTGDTGVKIIPASNPIDVACFLTLGASPSIGLANANASAQVVDVIWT